MSRTALDGFPFDDVANDELMKLIKALSRLYFAEILGFCLMGNHFHILVRMHTTDEYKDEQIKQRYKDYHGPDAVFPAGKIDDFRKKWSSLSEFVKEIKQTFSRAYNKRHGRRGTLWGERFKSVIVENGETLINCLAYIDLNPIRAGIVKRPEEYRWSSLGYHAQTGNKDKFLSMDFGLTEFGELNSSMRLRRYRQYVYEAGAPIQTPISIKT
jgi:putative transposase